MQEWESLTSNRCFISDLGENHTHEIDGTPTTIGRYAVWAPIPNAGRHQVVEIGEDVELLKQKYQVSQELVLSLDANPEGEHA